MGLLRVADFERDCGYLVGLLRVADFERDCGYLGVYHRLRGVPNRCPNRLHTPPITGVPKRERRHLR